MVHYPLSFHFIVFACSMKESCPKRGKFRKEYFALLKSVMLVDFKLI